MITDQLINMAYQLVQLIAQLVSGFGDAGTSTGITDSILNIKGAYLSLAAFFPLTTILSIIAFDLAFEGAYFTYKMIRWAYTKIPFIN